MITKLIRELRSPSLSFHLVGTAHFTIGTLAIEYQGTVDVAGPDRAIDLTESFNTGTVSALDARYVGGILYNLNQQTGAWVPDGSQNATVFGRISYHMQSTLVLGDLGATTVDGHRAYRLRVESGIDLYPPQFQDGTIASPHDPQGRLELTVDASGIPLSAHETRSLEGTIDGVPGTATGVFDVTFSQVGKDTTPTAPVLPTGVPVPTPQPTPSPIPATWVTPVTGDRGFTMMFPLAPVDGLTNVQSAAAGPLMLETRVAKESSGLAFTELDAAYPSAFMASHSVSDQLMESEQGGAASEGGQIYGSLPITVAGGPALEYFVVTKSTIYRSVVFIVGDRRVVLDVIGTLDEVGSTVADQFLDSVALAP